MDDDNNNEWYIPIGFEFLILFLIFVVIVIAATLFFSYIVLNVAVIFGSVVALVDYCESFINNVIKDNLNKNAITA